MKQIKVEKLLDLGNQIDEVLELRVLNDIHYRAEREGIRAVGDLDVSGHYRIYHQVREFKELLTLDIMAPYEKIDEQLSFEVAVHHYDYKIEETGIMMIIYLEVNGLREVDTMQIVKDELNSEINFPYRSSAKKYDAGVHEQQGQNKYEENAINNIGSDHYNVGIYEEQGLHESVQGVLQHNQEPLEYQPHFATHSSLDHYDAGIFDEQLPLAFKDEEIVFDAGNYEEQKVYFDQFVENNEYDAGIFEEQIPSQFSPLDRAEEMDEATFEEELDQLLLSDFDEPEETPVVYASPRATSAQITKTQPKKELIQTVTKSSPQKEEIEAASELEDLFDDAKNVIVNYRYVMAAANDTYQSLAARYKVSEKELIQLNRNKSIAYKTLIVLPYQSS